MNSKKTRGGLGTRLASNHFYGTVFIANTGKSEYAEVGVYGNGGLLAMQVRDIVNASLTLAMRMVARSVPASSAAQRNHIDTFGAAPPFILY